MYQRTNCFGGLDPIGIGVCLHGIYSGGLLRPRRSGCRRTSSRPPCATSATPPAVSRAPDLLAAGRTLAPQTVLLTNLPFAPAPEISIRKSVGLPPTRGATKPTKCSLCANKFYTSRSMLDHLAWHAVHATAPAEDQVAASHTLRERGQQSLRPAPYAKRKPPPPRRLAGRWHREGGGRRRPQRGRHRRTRVGGRATRPVTDSSPGGSPMPRCVPPWGRGPRTPWRLHPPWAMRPLQNRRRRRLCGTADSRKTLLSWNLRNGLVPLDRSLRDTLW